jgi:hypothetical protein
MGCRVNAAAQRQTSGATEPPDTPPLGRVLPGILRIPVGTPRNGVE